MSEPLPQRTPWMFDWFVWYGRRFLRKNFHAVRLARDGRPAAHADQPLIVYFNHPSWWDPMVAFVLSDRFKDRQHFGVIDQKMLEKYRMFARLGIFGIDPETRAGAAKFLRTAEAILAHDDSVLWITAEGAFTDPRKRPVRLRPGVAHLARRLERGVLLPLAIEYPFWNERYPELLLRFGKPIDVAATRLASAETWNGLLEERLQASMDRLAELSIARDPESFETLVGGNVGVGGVYDLWRRAKFGVRGKRFSAAHGDDE